VTVVFGRGKGPKLSCNLEQYTATFQAEVCAMKACAIENADKDYKTETFIFFLTANLRFKHLTFFRSSQTCLILP
jgi:hypothetical protein